MIGISNEHIVIIMDIYIRGDYHFNLHLFRYLIVHLDPFISTKSFADGFLVSH